MRAAIFGSCGQDGYYLTRYLKSLGYEVWGCDVIGPPEPDAQPDCFDTISVTDGATVWNWLDACKPDEVYHLAALTNVPDSWEIPWEFYNTNARGFLHVLDALHARQIPAKVFYAATSGMFGMADSPQNEHTPFMPLTPYDGSKLAGFHLAQMYRQRYGIQVSCGILYQHESPRKKYGVLHKVCETVRDIHDGKTDKLVLGDLGIVRDWCHASDMVRAMWEILRHPPGDWVVGTGHGRTIGELAGTVCGLMGVEGSRILSDPELYRPNDPVKLVADPRKILATGWTPVVSFGELLAEKLGKMPVVV